MHIIQKAIANERSASVCIALRFLEAFIEDKSNETSERLPSIADCAAAAGVAKNTMSKAVHRMIEAGLLVSVPRKYIAIRARHNGSPPQTAIRPAPKKWERVKDAVVSDLLRGTFGEEAVLPHPAEIARRYGISTSTARAEWSRNRLSGIREIVGKAGQGYVVHSHTVDTCSQPSDYLAPAKKGSQSDRFGELYQIWRKDIPDAYHFSTDRTAVFMQRKSLWEGEMSARLQDPFSQALSTSSTAWICADDFTAVPWIFFIPGAVPVRPTFP